MSNRRKKKSSIRDSDIEDPDFLLTPCLQIDPNVELRDIPTTGEEYLLKVMKERQKCLVVTKCNKDLSKFAKNQSRFVELEPVKSAPVGLKQTIEWQNIQVADFSEMRMYISQMEANKSSWPHTVKSIDLNNIDNLKMFFEETNPSLSYMFGIRQKFLDHCLGVLITSLEDVKPGETISKNIGRWIYSFMAYASLPLLADTVSLLRDLARSCSEIRSRLNVDDENAVANAAPLNLFICLVSRYFRQTDLADQ